MKLSVVVPAYNEEKLLAEALEHVRRGMAVFADRGWSCEFIVCDNNSTDRTAEIARSAGARVVFEPVNQISRARNTGAAVATGAKFIYVSFKGGGEVVLATLGGFVETTGENMSEMLPLVEAKKMRVLAVTGERRFVQAPDIPTARELGYDIIAATGRGFAMPAAVPKEAAAAMEAALKRVYDSQAYKEYSYRNMFDNNYLDGASFGKYLVKRRVVQEEFLRAIGVVK